MKLVRARGFEPRTLGLKDRYSDQLSYTRRIKEPLAKSMTYPKAIISAMSNLASRTLVAV